MQREGYDVTFLGVDGDGNLDLGEFIRALRPDTLLVTIMHANNETGVVFPIEQLSRLTKETDPAIVFHTDATQSVGKIPIDLRARVSARGPAVVFRPQVACPERNRRSVHQARHALPPCCDWRAPGGRPPRRHGKRAVHRGAGQGSGIGRRGYQDEDTRVRGLRDRLEQAIEERIPYVEVNGRGAPAAQHAERLLPRRGRGRHAVSVERFRHLCLQRLGLHVGLAGPSHVLRAMKSRCTAVQGSVRFSFSRYNTDADVDRIIEAFPEMVANLRRLSPYWDQEKNAPASSEELVRRATCVVRSGTCGVSLRTVPISFSQWRTGGVGWDKRSRSPTTRFFR